MPDSHKVQKLRNAPLQPGNSIVIEAVVYDVANKFQVKLLSDKDENEDIAAIFEFETNEEAESTLKCKSRRNNKESEEINIPGPFPFTFGKIFEMKIVFLEDKLTIYVDSEKYFDFPRRIELKRINYISIDGGIKLHSINYN